MTTLEQRVAHWRDCQRRLNEATESLLREIGTVQIAGRPLANVISIQETVVEFYGLPPGALLYMCRRSDHAKARHVAIYLARTLTPHSMHEIGRAFNRDHACVINSVQQVTNRANTETEFKAELGRIEAIALIRLGSAAVKRRAA